MDENIVDILDFWFKGNSRNDWFVVNPALDKKIADLFLSLHSHAVQGELFSWRETPEGALAEIIILDQFSRNIYRHDKRAFMNDQAALILAHFLRTQNFDKKLTNDQKLFAYLPYMHSESLVIQKESLCIFGELGNPQALTYAQKHFDVIEKFGRFPHRNSLLGRSSTLQESEYLLKFPDLF